MTEFYDDRGSASTSVRSRGTSRLTDCRHKHVGHSGGLCGRNAQQPVFEDKAALRLYSQPCGSEEEHVGGRFALIDIYRCDDSLKPVENAYRFETLTHDFRVRVSKR